MAFTYTKLLTTAISRVRRAVGDTASPGLIPDETITAYVNLYGEAGAIRAVAGALAAEYAQKPGSVTLPSGLSVSWAQRVTHWRAVALGQAGGAGAFTSFAAGAGRNDAYAATADTELTEGDDD